MSRDRPGAPSAPQPPNDCASPRTPELPGCPANRAQRSGALFRIFLGPRELRSGWRLLIFVALWAVLLGCSMALAHHFLGFARGASTLLTLLPVEALMLLSALAAAGILGVAERRSFAVYALPWRSALGRNFWWGVLWGGASLPALLLLIRLDHGFNFGTLTRESGRELLIAGAVWAAGFLVVASFEEFFFRGYALYTLSAGMGFWPAAVLLSIVFGAVHLRNTGENWIGALAAGLIGLFCCLTVRRTGSLWFAIGFHAAWDYSESFIFYVPDSGATIGHHLVNSALHGPAWLTGGSVGPEASVFVFAVIAALSILFHLSHPSAQFAVAQAP